MQFCEQEGILPQAQLAHIIVFIFISVSDFGFCNHPKTYHCHNICTRRSWPWRKGRARRAEGPRREPATTPLLISINSFFKGHAAAINFSLPSPPSHFSFRPHDGPLFGTLRRCGGGTPDPWRSFMLTYPFFLLNCAAGSGPLLPRRPQEGPPHRDQGHALAARKHELSNCRKLVITFTTHSPSLLLPRSRLLLRSALLLL